MQPAALCCTSLRCVASTHCSPSVPAAPGRPRRSPLLFAAARGAYIVESGHFDPVEEYGHVKGFGFDFDHRRQVGARHAIATFRQRRVRACQAGQAGEHCWWGGLATGSGCARLSRPCTTWAGCLRKGASRLHGVYALCRPSHTGACCRHCSQKTTAWSSRRISVGTRPWWAAGHEAVARGSPHGEGRADDCCQRRQRCFVQSPAAHGHSPCAPLPAFCST